MKLWLNILIVVCVLLTASSLKAEETKPNFKVRIKIDAEEDIKQKTESYISRKLRSLGDVTIVDIGEDCEIEIVLIKSETFLAFSVIYYESQDVKGLLLAKNGLSDLMILLKSHPVTEQRQELIKKVSVLQSRMVSALSTVGYYSAKYHWLYTCGIDRLRSRCEKIIVDFDNLYLKPKREKIAEIEAMVYGEE